MTGIALPAAPRPPLTAPEQLSKPPPEWFYSSRKCFFSQGNGRPVYEYLTIPIPQGNNTSKAENLTQRYT